MGIDLAKNVFQLHGVDAECTAVFKKRVRRKALLAELVDVPTCGIGIEACTGAFWWQRQFEALGHTVKVIAPQYVNRSSNIKRTIATTRKPFALR